MCERFLLMGAEAAFAARFGIFGMAKYYCRFFDEHNQLVRAERMVALDDTSAVANARAAVDAPVKRFEVWRNVNFIHEEKLTIQPDQESR
jgi:hypothetical protein